MAPKPKVTGTQPSNRPKTSKKVLPPDPKGKGKGKGKGKSKEATEIANLQAKLAAAEAALLVKRNADLLDEEEDPRPRKKAKPVAPVSEEEEEDDFTSGDGIGLDLGAPRVSTPKPTASPVASDGEGSNKGSEDDEDPEEDADSRERSPSPMRGGPEDMVVDDVVPKNKTKKQPRKPRGSNSSNGTTASSKVTQSDFSPPSLRLANMGRYAVRVGIATDVGFPLKYAEWTSKTLEAAVVAADDESLAERLALTNGDTDRRSKMLGYAWGGGPQIRSELKTKCKAAVSLFGIPGTHTPAEIVEIIEWLTCKKGIFKFGDLDIAARTYNVQKPYGHAFYQDVITKQFFPSSTADAVRPGSFEQYVDLNIPIFTIVTSGMENSLKEYASGVRVKIKFTTEEHGPRYAHHRAALENLKTNSPAWFADFQHKLYSLIVNTTTFSHLKTPAASKDDDELDGVDFAALEASVGVNKPASATITSLGTEAASTTAA